MKAILSTTLIGLVAACSYQQPANSPEMKSTTEPVHERAYTNATGGSNETTAAGITPTAPETVEPAQQPTDNTAPSAAERSERANSVATPQATSHDARANRPNDEGDERADAPTPIDQGESATDRAATQQIRKALMADDSLSFTAKNVKVITLNGKVTLRGSVNSARERTTIEAAAKKTANVTSVDNQLEVKTQSSKGPQL